MRLTVSLYFAPESLVFECDLDVGCFPVTVEILVRYLGPFVEEEHYFDFRVLIRRLG